MSIFYRVLEVTDKYGIPKDNDNSNMVRGTNVYLSYKGIGHSCGMYNKGFVMNTSQVEEYKECKNGITIIVTKNSIYTLEKQEEN